MSQASVFEASIFSKSFWYEYQLDKESSIYNRCGICELGSDLDVEKLESSIQILVESNFNLRSVFFEKDETLYQEVSNNIKGKLITEYATTETQREAILNEHIDAPLSVEKGPLFRFVLIHQEYDNRYTFLVIFHHMIADGSCYRMLYKDIEQIYNGNLPSEDFKTESLNSFQSYLQWEKEQVESAKMPEFYNRLDDEYFPVDVSIRKDAKPSNKITDTKLKTFTLNEDKLKELKTFSEETNISIFNIIKSAWALLIARYSNQDKVLVSYPVTTRGKEFRNIKFGLVNSLLYLLEEKGSFIDILKAGKEDNTQMFEAKGKYFPLYKSRQILKERIGLKDASSLLRVTVVSAISRILDPQISKDLKTQPTVDSTNELLLEYYTENNQINCLLSYSSSLYDDEHIEQLSNCFSAFLSKLIKHSNTNTSELSILDDEEYQKIVFDWNKTEMEYPNDTTIHQLFEKQTLKTPDNVALVFEDQQLTFKELNEKANQLANAIRTTYKTQTGSELKADTLIGLYTQRSFELVISILAILKSGAAYVPFSTTEPQERTLEKLKDCACKVVISNIPFLNDDILQKEEVTTIDVNAFNFEDYPSNNLDIAYSPNDVAYVIYTSGSTGNPKGILTEHGHFINHLYSRKVKSNFTKNDVLLLKTPLTFDVSVLEIFMSALIGSKLIITKHEGHKEPEYLRDIIYKHKVTRLEFVPSLLSVFVATLKHGEKHYYETVTEISNGGEILKPQLCKDTLELIPSASIHNYYGATETTLVATTHQYDSSKPEATTVPAGKPYHNYSVYVLDNQQQPLPIGAIGEVYAGGESIARGYLNKPELTKKCFIQNPFATKRQTAKGINQIIYKTGDLCYWLPDGNLEFVGRNDDQVKVRGFRIELGEIETKLNNHPQVKHSVVLVKERNNSNYLAAWYTASNELESNELHNYLSDLLPDYMVPSTFMYLEKFPTNTNGKVDKRALPKAKIIGNKQFIAPTTTTEKQLAEVWKNVLEVETVSTNNNFFSIGGDSISVLLFVHRYEKLFNIKIPINDVYKHKTLKALAEVVDTNFEAYYTREVEHDYNPITLHKEGEGTPIYIIAVPPQGPHLYNEFITNFKGENPIYSVYISENTIAQELDSITNWFVDKIETYAEHKEFILAGFSLSGFVALQIASILETKNYKQKVLLFDAGSVNLLKQYNSRFYKLKLLTSNIATDLKVLIKHIIKGKKPIASIFGYTYNVSDKFFSKMKRAVLGQNKIEIADTYTVSDDDKQRKLNFELVRTYVFNSDVEYTFKGDILLIKTIDKHYVDCEKSEKYNHWNFIFTTNNFKVKTLIAKHGSLLKDAPQEVAKLTQQIILE